MGLGRGLGHIGLLRGARWGPGKGLKGAEALCWALHPSLGIVLGATSSPDPARSVQLPVFRSKHKNNAWFKSAGLP